VLYESRKAELEKVISDARSELTRLSVQEARQGSLVGKYFRRQDRLSKTWRYVKVLRLDGTGVVVLELLTGQAEFLRGRSCQQIIFWAERYYCNLDGYTEITEGQFIGKWKNILYSLDKILKSGTHESHFFFWSPSREKKLLHYDYFDGRRLLFSCETNDLAEAHDKRDEWLRKR